MYGEFLKSIEAETSAVAAVIGCTFGSMSCAGLLANVLLHTIPMRLVGLFGAVIFFLGSVLCTFVTSIGTLIFSFSILQGDFPTEMFLRKEKCWNSYIWCHSHRFWSWFNDPRCLWNIQLLFCNETHSSDESGSDFEGDYRDDTSSSGGIFDDPIWISWHSSNNGNNQCPFNTCIARNASG